MKKFSKMLALGVAAALTFGMTVSAAESPSTDGGAGGALMAGDAISAGGVKDVNGNAVDVTAEATVLPSDAFNETFGMNYEEVVDKAYNDPVIDAALDKALENLPAGDYTVNHSVIDVKVDGEIPAGGLYVSLWQVGTLKDECGYVIGHWNVNTNKWEVLPTKIENGFVYALFPEGFSPVYLSVLTVSEEQEPTPTPTPTPGPGNNDDNNNNNSEPVSPKTGETVPVAGILALICLAGVAVCAKKVNYNK